jgi:signal transduction histidine kinase
MNRVEFILKYLKRQSLIWHFIQALSLTAVIGLIDYSTGNEVTVDPFYSIPILLMVWFGNRNLAIVISVCCALAWWWANAAGGHSYSSEWLRIWDVIVRLMFFSLVVFAGVIFKQQRDSIADRVELLERSQQLEREIISISEREQQRIGRDLHDGMPIFGSDQLYGGHVEPRFGTGVVEPCRESGRNCEFTSGCRETNARSGARSFSSGSR